MDNRIIHGKCPRGRQSQKYTAFRNILARCSNPNHPQYKDYGGRGITCAWSTFAAFDRDVPDPCHGDTIERVDNDGNYEQGNVRWATRKAQSNNTRTNVLIECQGRRQTVTQWASECGIQPGTLYKRLFAYGWTPDRALCTLTA